MVRVRPTTDLLSSEIARAIQELDVNTFIAYNRPMCCTTETKSMHVEPGPFERGSDALASTLRTCHNLDAAQPRQCGHINPPMTPEALMNNPSCQILFSRISRKSGISPGCSLQISYSRHPLFGIQSLHVSSESPCDVPALQGDGNASLDARLVDACARVGKRKQIKWQRFPA